MKLMIEVDTNDYDIPETLIPYLIIPEISEAFVETVQKGDDTFIRLFEALSKRMPICSQIIKIRII